MVDAQVYNVARATTWRHVAFRKSAISYRHHSHKPVTFDHPEIRTARRLFVAHATSRTRHAMSFPHHERTACRIPATAVARVAIRAACERADRRPQGRVKLTFANTGRAAAVFDITTSRTSTARHAATSSNRARRCAATGRRWLTTAANMTCGCLARTAITIASPATSPTGTTSSSPPTATPPSRPAWPAASKRVATRSATRRWGSPAASDGTAPPRPEHRPGAERGEVRSG